MSMQRKVSIWALLGLFGGIFAVILGFLPREASAIPAFARKYRTSCLTCHVMPPRLNAFGTAFRLNGYQIPDGDEPHIKDEPVVLAASAWKEMWPNANWPGWIPGSPPIALRVILDTETTRANKAYTTNFEFPHEVEFLAGGTFGEDLGFFGELEMHINGPLEVKQTFLKFQNPLESLGVPHRALNLWIGLMDHVYLTSYRNLERVGKNHPLWGNKKMTDFTVRSSSGTCKAGNSFRLQNFQPAIELNGILGKRLFWGYGVTTGAGTSRFDVDNHKDSYYKLAYKFGGRAYDGSLPGEREVSLAVKPAKGWVDNSLEIEHFGYFGKQRVSASGGGCPSTAGSTDQFNRFGVALRWRFENLDLAGGYVWGRNSNPWGRASEDKLNYSSPFVRADYMIFPWWMAQLRFEHLDVESPSDLRAAGFTAGSLDQTRLLPAFIFLIRPNIRFVMEGELYVRHRDSDTRNQPTPHTFWTRMDFDF